LCLPLLYSSSLFRTHHTPTTDISTLSLHDALPIWRIRSIDRTADGVAHKFRSGGEKTTPSFSFVVSQHTYRRFPDGLRRLRQRLDRKSTRLNSSHVAISYAVFCLKKKN